MRRAVLLLAVLALAGCGSQLDTSYGPDAGDGSINGCRTFLGVCAARSRLRTVARLSPLLERGECRVLIHVATRPGLPDRSAIDWLERWLGERSDRRALLILRDGSTTAWLGRRWLDELDALPAGERGDDHQERRDRLAALLGGALEPAWPATAAASGPLRAIWSAGARPRRLDPGLPVPAAMTAGLALSASAPAQPLITAELADGRRLPWALELPVDDGGRLVVAANATPLLDGALPDPAARRLAGHLLDAVLPPDGERPLAAVVERLSVHTGEPEAANPMALLFARPPLAWAAWHLVAIALLLVGAAALWVGRREDPSRARQARFGRHLDALARHLREGGHGRWCAQAIARWRGLPPPPPALDEASARAWRAARSVQPPGKRP